MPGNLFIQTLAIHRFPGNSSIQTLADFSIQTLAWGIGQGPGAHFDKTSDFDVKTTVKQTLSSTRFSRAPMARIAVLHNVSGTESEDLQLFAKKS